MWNTLHRLKKADGEHKKMVKEGEQEEDIAWKESLIRTLDNKFIDQYNQFKNLTEQI
jgi:hypothetical protein